ncbi:MAG TPA: adenine deaminase [Flexilinea sp.]|nr:adenine deaminase [Flexilinea sp.]
MAHDIESFKQELKAAGGKCKVDLILENIRLVDVYTSEIRPASLAIFNGRIVALDPASDFQAFQRIDGNGMFAVPGFIDTHMHIETTLLTPEALAEAITPWGTTSLFVDAMEIANVAGKDGLSALIKDSDRLPFRIYLEIPSRVPTAPGLETTGGTIGIDETKDLFKLEETVSLGELDPAKVLEYKDEYLEKILSAYEARRICNGHAIGLTPEELNVYATGHLSDDHETVTYEELLNRLRVGIPTLIREGSSERNVEELIRGIIEHNLPTDNLMFCTDDKHVNDIFREGHISYNIQKSIQMGLDPIEAIKMATIHAARHFHLEHQIGSLTPGRFADIVLLPDLKEIKPALVLKGGKIVSQNGKPIPVKMKDYPAFLFDTVKLKSEITSDRFRIQADGKQALCRVIQLIPDQIINREIQDWLPIVNGQIDPQIDRDILKLAVVERYGKNGRVSVALVQGFMLKKGALASSVSHDHHNIVTVGTNDSDMAMAVREIAKMKGGFVACSGGKIIGKLELPLAGLMSVLPAHDVMQQMNDLNSAARSLGVEMAAPFMTLSFISLPTVPQLGLTDYGLIDVLGHRLTDLIIEVEN